MFSLFPREEDFFVLFRKQAALVREGCSQLLEMVTAFDRLEERARQLKEVEHRADVVTHEIFERLNRTFITPLEREDIHQLASNLDDVLDGVEAIGSRVLLFQVGKPPAEAVRMATILTECAVQIEQAVDNLKQMNNLISFTMEINRLENEADGISRQVTADLFSGKHDLLDVMRWKEIYDRLEDAADKCEDVANAIESIVVKSR
jgi:predicted phosphate transport protein (TIGR00153 family)